MMDLGKYASYILGAYGAAFGILLGVLLVTLFSLSRTRKKLKALEKSLKVNHDLS